jgi:site-specific DNA-methyltransferase (adenine-specific)
MKPLDQSTYAGQALANGHGITWLDDCRIPYASESDKIKCEENAAHLITLSHNTDIYGNGNGYHKTSDLSKYTKSSTGRFPANLLVSDDVLNDGRIIKGGTYNQYNKGGGFDNLGDGTYNHGATINDKGSYSRYFDLDAWSNQLPFLIVPKASKKEKNAGCEGLEAKGGVAGEVTVRGNTNPVCQKCGGSKIDRGNGECKCEIPEWKAVNNTTKNIHPCVKPIKLMAYLITMGSRPNQVVLDPFAGSGTTLVAAKQLGRRFIGIEMSAEYVEIINARLNAV